MEFATFQRAYAHWLRSVFEEPEFRNAPRGFPSRERLGVSFRLLDPVQRHVPLASRRTNLVFNFAEALWYLSGTNDLEQIAYYAPSIRKYSADGRTLTGTAYGTRIFRHGEQCLDQWSQVRKTLAEDRDSKRAVIQIFEAPELAIVGNIDVACTLALQFFIREDRLHGVGFMRANDAFRGMVSDVFSFTLLLEIMASQLGVRVGSYSHQVGSLHVYESDRDWARQVLDEDTAVGGQPLVPFPAMPAEDNWPHVTAVLELERALRMNDLALSAAAVRRLELPHYWRQVVTMFEIYREIRHEAQVDHAHLESLAPVFRQSMLIRWPSLMAQSAASR